MYLATLLSNVLFSMLSSDQVLTHHPNLDQLDVPDLSDNNSGGTKPTRLAVALISCALDIIPPRQSIVSLLFSATEASRVFTSAIESSLCLPRRTSWITSFNHLSLGVVEDPPLPSGQAARARSPDRFNSLPIDNNVVRIDIFISDNIYTRCSLTNKASEKSTYGDTG
jgi:hypothetical protein